MAARKKKLNKTDIQSLSSVESIPNKIEVNSDDSYPDIQKKVQDAISNLELQKSIERWLKENKKENAIVIRDLNILKGIISEYLDAFLIFGYNMNGERVIIQNFKNARDRDAIMEFLKTVFIKQQQENFLDGNGE
jgi:hypothetical protein